MGAPRPVALALNIAAGHVRVRALAYRRTTDRRHVARRGHTQRVKLGVQGGAEPPWPDRRVQHGVGLAAYAP